jgi:hypothetical protein
MINAKRRKFLKGLFFLAISPSVVPKMTSQASIKKQQVSDPRCSLYRAVNGTSAENMQKVITLMGGIKTIVGEHDIVIIKPNVQWWNQGAPNLSALKAYVDLVMNRTGGFTGEVVILENCHRGPRPGESNGAGWSNNFIINADIPDVNNINDLCVVLKQQYGDRFTRYHLIDVNAGNKRVCGPSEGTGYVYCDGTDGVPLIECDNGASGADNRKVIMTYPVIKTDRGTIVDYKNGVWEKGAYTKQPVRFINFAALNHHSTYCGATSAVKNYLGISDLSGGADPDENGKLTPDSYNFHSFPLNKWQPGPVRGMLGAEIGMFLKEIRKPDLNVTTAEWVGLASRTHPPVANTRCVMASSDPVALDYHATKYVLYPNSRIAIHNPDNAKGPLYADLRQCAETGGFVFDESYVEVKNYDVKKRQMQQDHDLSIFADTLWRGTDLKTFSKYVYMRFAL